MTLTIKKLMFRRAADLSPHFLYHKRLPSKTFSPAPDVFVPDFALQGEYIPTGMPSYRHFPVDIY
jgi:hypothetical protein